MGLENQNIEIQGYHKLEIYQRSRSLAIRIHELTLTLPRFETYEECSQIRRSSKSITNNIVEGYALRKNKNEFLQYLNRAYGSCEETIQHLDFLFSTRSFKDEITYKELHVEYNQLSKMIFRFIQSVNSSHEKPYYIKEDMTEYCTNPNPQSLISNPLPLLNRTVLITRSADSNSEFRLLLESRGASVICFPTIEITNPDSWDECDKVIWKLAEYQGVCFTSKNAVVKFVERIRTLRPQAVDTLATRNIFAVGTKTKMALESCGFTVIASPAHASAQELAKVLQSHQIKGARILIPKSQIARDELPKQLREMGAVVDEVVVYKTIIPEAEKAGSINDLLRKNQIDVITFFSPSSAINFAEMFGCDSLSTTLTATIGQTTAETLNQLGVKKVIVAKQAAAESMAVAIEEYFNQNG